MAFAFKETGEQEGKQASHEQGDQKPSTVTIRTEANAEKREILICAACRRADDMVKLVDDETASALKRGDDSIFRGFDKIPMHGECLEGVVKNVPPKKETPRSTYNFVHCGEI